MVSLQDTFYLAQLTHNNIFGLILDIVYETMPRDNLLNSACLELFEYIKRENIKPIITHVVEKCRDKLKAVTYVDTFENLIQRYDQLQGYEMQGDATLYSQQEAALPQRGPVNGQWQGVRGLDAAEEEYFNTSDDEEEVCIRMHGYVEAELIMTSLQWPPEARQDEMAPQNQAPANIKLVDYPDDDDDEVMDAKSDATIDKQEIELPERGVETDAPSTPTATQPQNPPERLSEKRRRDDEDDDELVRLAQNGPKRRSSNASSTGSSYLRRRRNSVEQSITSKKAAGDVSKSAAPKKIAINLSPSLKSSVTVEAEAIQISDIEHTGNNEPEDDTENENGK